MVALESGARITKAPLLRGIAVFGLFRYHLLVETAGFGEKPEDVALLDRPFQLCVVGFAAVAVASLYLKI